MCFNFFVQKMSIFWKNFIFFKYAFWTSIANLHQCACRRSYLVASSAWRGPIWSQKSLWLRRGFQPSSSLAGSSSYGVFCSFPRGIWTKSLQRKPWPRCQITNACSTASSSNRLGIHNQKLERKKKDIGNFFINYQDWKALSVLCCWNGIMACLTYKRGNGV